VLNAGWLAEMDAAVRKARAAGLEVSWNKMWQPIRMIDYGDFVEFVVRRYSPMGVNHYEIWNEPNHPYFWPSGVSASSYTEMLRAGSVAVRAANPSATVVLGGLSKSDSAYMSALYAAGAGPLFDAAAIHPLYRFGEPVGVLDRRVGAEGERCVLRGGARHDGGRR